MPRSSLAHNDTTIVIPSAVKESQKQTEQTVTARHEAVSKKGRANQFSILFVMLNSFQDLILEQEFTNKILHSISLKMSILEHLIKQ